MSDARRRLRACVEAWPECVSGAYDPRCCRFPKSCSCTSYDEAIADADLEHPCPKGDECALNNGAIHCFACRRNWPRDDTWDMPFEQRPIQQRVLLRGFIVRLFTGHMLIDAASEDDARREFLQALAEDLSLLAVEPVRREVDDG